MPFSTSYLDASVAEEIKPFPCCWVTWISGIDLSFWFECRIQFTVQRSRTNRIIGQLMIARLLLSVPQVFCDDFRLQMIRLPSTPPRCSKWTEEFLGPSGEPHHTPLHLY